MIHILISIAIIVAGCLLLWFAVRQYNAAAKRKIDPMFILNWGLNANKQIDMALGVFLGIVGVGLGLYGVYYGFTG
jgi:hypothetical protein